MRGSLRVGVVYLYGVIVVRRVDHCVFKFIEVGIEEIIEGIFF